MRWQSWLVLAAVLPACAMTTFQHAHANRAWNQHGPGAAGPSGTRRHSPGGVDGRCDRCGADTCSSLLFRFPSWHRSALPSLMALFVLTWAATRFGTKPETAPGPGGGQAWTERRPGSGQPGGRRIGSGVRPLLSIAWLLLRRGCGGRTGGSDRGHPGQRTGRSFGRPTVDGDQPCPGGPGDRWSGQPRGHGGGNGRGGPGGIGCDVYAWIRALRGSLCWIGRVGRPLYRFRAGRDRGAAWVAQQRRSELPFHVSGFRDCDPDRSVVVTNPDQCTLRRHSV